MTFGNGNMPVNDNENSTHVDIDKTIAGNEPKETNYVQHYEKKIEISLNEMSSIFPNRLR